MRRASLDDVNFAACASTRDLLERDGIGEKLALFTMGCYALLLAGSYHVGRDSLHSLLPREREAAGIAFAVLLVNVLPRTYKLLILPRGLKSGNAALMLSVNTVSMFSNMCMFLWPMPIVIDPVTTARCHLARWAEWSILSFTMMFAVEAVDSTSLWWPVALGTSIGLSTFCGMLLPFFGTWPSAWGIVLAFAFATYAVVFPRLRYKLSELAALDGLVDADADSLERRIRLDVACRLMMSCAVMWTMFVLAFFAEWAGHALHDEARDGNGAYPQWPFIFDCFTDVLCKLIYTDMVHEHLEEPRKIYEQKQLATLNARSAEMWRSYSHVLLVSTRLKGGELHTLASPSVAELVSEPCASQWTGGLRHDEGKTGASPVVAMPAAGGRAPGSSFQKGGEGGGEPGARGADAPSLDDAEASSASALEVSLAQSGRLEQLVCRAWREANGSADGSCALEWRTCRATDGAERVYEVDGRSEPGSCMLLLVVHDVTQRLELRYAEERVGAVSRKKDGEISHFARHMMKNGVLSALGVCDALREISEEQPAGAEPPAARHGAEPPLPDAVRARMRSALDELNGRLQHMLNAVLTEAMVRDIVHDVYKPCAEPIQLDSLLAMGIEAVTSGCGAGGVAGRFACELVPMTMPFMILDPRLLFFIHRAALVNAIRYGAPNAPVHTAAFYSSGQLTLRISNMAGAHHDQLRALADTSVIFRRGTRLHAADGTVNLLAFSASSASFSAAAAGLPASSVARRRRGSRSAGGGGGGDGGELPGGPSLESECPRGESAWIMAKCARALGGSVEITFGELRTVLTLRCPAPAYIAHELSARFVVPQSTFGIGIDDSKVQRVLIDKIFEAIGVRYDRKLVLGETDAEIVGFVDRSAALIRAHPEARFVFIVDENLELSEVQGGMTVSGSRALCKLSDLLQPDQLRRALFCVRSANDSASDYEQYMRTAHAVIQKRGFHRQAVLESFSKAWAHRFGPLLPDVEEENEEEADLNATVTEELKAHVRKVDALAGAAHWPQIVGTLGLLKGELLSVSAQPPSQTGAAGAAGGGGVPASAELLAALDRLRELKERPVGFANAWATLSAAILVHVDQLSGKAGQSAA